MDGLTKREFLAADEVCRAALCVELGRVLTERLMRDRNFHEGVASLVAELRSLGHDLWSYDEEDEYETWGPDYQTPTGPGILVTFRRAPEPVIVEWASRFGSAR